MTPAKRPTPATRKKAPARDTPAEAPRTETIVRGLTRDDWDGIDRAMKRRMVRAESVGLEGAYVSRNSVLLSLLRAGIERDDDSDAAPRRR